ncbi:MAG: YceI family protein [Rhodanobacteraceae bacterium]
MRARVSALLVVLACGAANAAAWPIDSAHSRAHFSVRTLWFTHERGEFSGVYGELRQVDAQHDRVDAWIDAGSLSMDDEDALNEASGPGFFDVASYPRIHFVSAPFPAEALRGGGALDGTLELHGLSHYARFQLEPSQCPAQPLACPVRVQGTLSRSAFGMRTHRGWLSDRVSLELNIALGPS